MGIPQISSHFVRRVLENRGRRKLLAEMCTTVAVDALWPKRKVLAAYLRVAYLGVKDDVPIIGFEDAAAAYFGKSLISLSIAETALLAGLVKDPTIYSPAKHPDRARDRRRVVLEAMKRSRTITGREFNRALEEPLPNEA